MRALRQGMLCAAAILFALEAPAACKPWVEVRTDRIRAISDRPQEEVVTVVDTIARFEDFVSRITNAGKFEPSRPTLMVMLGRPEWQRYMPFAHQRVGLFRPGLTENLMLLQEPQLNPLRLIYLPTALPLRPEEPSPYEAILEGYVYFMLGDDTLQYPGWYRRGMAEVLGDVHFEGSQLRYGVMWASELVDARIARRARKIGVADLIERFPALMETPKPILRQEVNALAKVLVHYLSFSSAERANQVPQFLALVNEGVADAVAFRAAFRTDYTGMDRELDEYLRRVTFPGGFMDWTSLAGSRGASAVELACEEALVEIGLAMLFAGADSEVISSGWFKSAAIEVPGSVPAQIGLAHVAELKGDSATVDGILDGIDPSTTPLRWRNWAAFLPMSRVLRAQRDQQTPRAEDLTEGRRWYPEADYTGEAEAAPAYYQAAFLHLNGEASEGSAKRGAEFAKKAVAIRPKDWASAQMVARFLQGQGDHAGSVPYWQVVARFASNPATRQDAIRRMREAASAAPDPGAQGSAPVQTVP